MSQNKKPEEPFPIRSDSPKLQPPRRIDICDLLGDGRELRILHGSEEYRLSLTSKGKLILTK